jgi:uncharacterized protein
VATKSLKQETTLSIKDGRLRIAVIADTHSEPHQKSTGLVKELTPDAILHAGDIGDLGVLDKFAKIAPMHAVRGNIDVHAHDLPDELTINVLNESGGDVMKLFLFHIAVYGPKLRADAARKAKAVEAQMVVCGHSHVPFIGRDKGLMIFNPGSIGPRRFQLPIVFGVIDITRDASTQKLGMSMKHISCETGAQWLP